MMKSNPTRLLLASIALSGICVQPTYANHTAPNLGTDGHCDTSINPPLPGADYSYCDLSNAGDVFKGKLLLYANFSNSLLRGLDFTGANLQFAYMRLADAEDANFYLADLHAADLQAAKMSRVNAMNANFDAANLRYASMVGATIYEANFEVADLTLADLTGVLGSRSIFRGAFLVGATLERANLADADFENADLRGAYAADADFTGAKLKWALLKDSTFYRALLRRVDASDAYAPGAYFNLASLDYAVLHNTTLTLAQFADASLASTQLDCYGNEICDRPSIQCGSGTVPQGDGCVQDPAVTQRIGDLEQEVADLNEILISGKIVLCHMGDTTTISIASFGQHLNHGDTAGACQ